LLVTFIIGEILLPEFFNIPSNSSQTSCIFWKNVNSDGQLRVFFYKRDFRYALYTGPSNRWSLAIHKHAHPFLYDTLLILFLHLLQYVDLPTSFLPLVCTRPNCIQILIAKCLLTVQTFSLSLIWPVTICLYLMRGVRVVRVRATSALLPCVFLKQTDRHTVTNCMAVNGVRQRRIVGWTKRHRACRASLLVCRFLAFFSQFWSNYLVPRSTALLEKLTVCQLVEKFPRFSWKSKKGLCVNRCSWTRETCRILILLLIISLTVSSSSTDCIASIFRVQAFQKYRWWWWW
jgi:hypothetical protein